MDKAISKKIIKLLSQRYGSINPDLKYIDLYQLTIAVVLSAQTTDKQVNSVTPILFGKYPDFKSLSGAKIKEITKIIRSTGFYRNKSKNIIELSKIITKQHKGIVPDNMKELIKLPGIGRKSANVILSIGFKKPALAVDTHVARITKRLGYTLSHNPVEVERDVTAIIPRTDWIKAHLLFIKHGREICKARKPLCRECAVNSLCPDTHNIPYRP